MRAWECKRNDRVRNIHLYLCMLVRRARVIIFSGALVSKFSSSANMARWRKFAVLVVWTLIASAISRSGCSGQIPDAGVGEDFRSRARVRDEDNWLFVRDGQWPGRMRRDLREECDSSQYEESEMLELPATIGPTDRADVGSLRELYIRLNMRGDVEVMDDEGEFLSVELLKNAETLEEVSLITHQVELHETKKGKVLVVQVDYAEKATSLLTMIGGVVAVLVLFVIIIIVIWLYHKRHLEEPPPPPRSRQGSQTSQGQPSPSRKNIMRSGTGEASPNIRRQAAEQTSPHHKNRLVAGDMNQPPLSLPPPPPRAARIYTPTEDTDGTSQNRRQPASGGSRGMYRGAMVTFTVLSVVTIASAAICTMFPTAKIIVRIPHGFNIEPSYISVFFNRRYNGHVITDRWSKMNSTTTNPNYKIRVFDLDDASLSSNRICSAEDLCNTAHTQGLAGCDIAVQRCVCSRGFRWDDKWCMDINECKENPNICPAGITCSNRLGYYQCNCPSGFFFKHGKCTRCSPPCPRGQFESTPCAGMKDRQCKDCSRCPEGMYAVQPCGGTVDKHCIHSAHPVLIGEEDAFPAFIQECF